MSSTEQLQIAPVPASIDNPDDWQTLADQIATATAIPTVLTPAVLVGMIGTAVPLLFAADAARNPDLLRGTFADPVVAQCQHNAGSLDGEQAQKVVVRLVGSRVVDNHPVLRVHLSIQTQDGQGNPGAQNQFWDLEAGAEVTVGQTACPNCGAPVGPGELVCSHCHADVRSQVEAPLVVSRLELY